MKPPRSSLRITARAVIVFVFTVLAVLAAAAPARAATGGFAGNGGEVWALMEARVPVYGAPGAIPRLALRFIGEFRFAGRSDGLYQGLFRTGPVIDVTDHLVLAVNFVAAGDRTATGGLTREFRAELEPLFHQRLRLVQIMARQRVELRFREKDTVVRTRFLGRLNFGPERWRLAPYLLEEIFFLLNEEGLNQSRTHVGLSIHIRDGMRVDVAYLLRARLQLRAAGFADPDPSPARWWYLDHGLLVNMVVGPGTRGTRGGFLDLPPNQ